MIPYFKQGICFAGAVILATTASIVKNLPTRCNLTITNKTKSKNKKHKHRHEQKNERK